MIVALNLTSQFIPMQRSLAQASHGIALRRLVLWYFQTIAWCKLHNNPRASIQGSLLVDFVISRLFKRKLAFSTHLSAIKIDGENASISLQNRLLLPRYNLYFPSDDLQCLPPTPSPITEFYTYIHGYPIAGNSFIIVLQYLLTEGYCTRYLQVCLLYTPERPPICRILRSTFAEAAQWSSKFRFSLP